MATIQIDGRPLVLPRMIDKRPNGTFCTRADGDGGYAENFEGYLQMTFTGWDGVYFDYIFEDDTQLSDLTLDGRVSDLDFMDQKKMLILLIKIGVEADENGVPLKDILAALE